MSDIIKARKAFHNFFDPIWQSGIQSRESIYNEFSAVLNREAHVSKMSLAEIKKCAEYLIAKQSKQFPCGSCENCVAMRYFIPVCKKDVTRKEEYCDCYIKRAF